jgi:hypothetical protein
MSDLPLRPHVQLLVLDRIDDAQNMARFCVLSVEPTLFEEVSLVREWVVSAREGGSNFTRMPAPRAWPLMSGSRGRRSEDTNQG